MTNKSAAYTNHPHTDPRAIAKMMGAGSDESEGHSDRVAQYAEAIGKRLDLSDKMLSDLHSAAVLHDIGKVGISSSIVNKLGKLSETEFEVMRLHSAIAVRMLEKVEGLQDSLPMIRHHHERFDGKGYPDGLLGHDIPLGARIIAVAETFDILISDLPWRESLSVAEALDELVRCAGTQFDPSIVGVFVSLVKSGGVLADEIAEIPAKRLSLH
ncbi:MAG: HD-GYP domain-containing protein [Armatimonadota bacterium]